MVPSAVSAQASEYGHVRSEQSGPCQFWKHEHLSLAPQMPLPEQPLGHAAEARPTSAKRIAVFIVKE